MSHICDFTAYDHMLFLLVLCAGYRLVQWKKIAILVTAFTLGHCLTLILVGMGVLRIPPHVIELLIPVTIALAAIGNIMMNKDKSAMAWRIEYATVFFFGLIHGAGFSNFFRSMFSADDGIVIPLLSFNIGVEIGQLLIVTALLVLQYIVVDLIFSRLPFGKKASSWWRIGISLIGFCIAMYWIVGK